MGSFRGHALPGTLFMTIAAWWTINISKNILNLQRNHRNTVSYPLLLCSNIEFPIEGVVKILGSGVDIIGELYDAFHTHSTSIIGANTTMDTTLEESSPIVLEDIQHATISCFFLIHGIFEILKWKNCYKISLELDYLTLIIAFVVEGMMFYFHVLYRTNILDKTMHQLLLVAILGCVISLTIEYKYRNSLLAGFTRTLFVFIQGTWFFQMAFVLYPRFIWQREWYVNYLTTDASTIDNSKGSIFVATLFAWNIVIVFILMSVLYCFTKLYYKTSSLCISGCKLPWNIKTLKPQNGSIFSHHSSRQDEDTSLSGGQYELIDPRSDDEQEPILETVSTHGY